MLGQFPDVRPNTFILILEEMLDYRKVQSREQPP